MPNKKGNVEFHITWNDLGGFDPVEDVSEPFGSCDWCGTNLYRDDEWDGLCDQCAWHAQQGGGSDGDIQPVV